MPNDRSWITVGAEVAVRARDASMTITFARIERLTQTLIVLADGRRFSQRDLYERVKPGHVSAQLMDPKNPHVVQTFARQQLRAFAREADRLVSGSGATVHTMTPAQCIDVPTPHTRVASIGPID